jgi:hypothetical protein
MGISATFQGPKFTKPAINLETGRRSGNTSYNTFAPSGSLFGGISNKPPKQKAVWNLNLGRMLAVESLRRGGWERLEGRRIIAAGARFRVSGISHYRTPSTPNSSNLKKWFAAWSRIQDEATGAPEFVGIDTRTWEEGAWLDSWHDESYLKQGIGGKVPFYSRAPGNGATGLALSLYKSGAHPFPRAERERFEERRKLELERYDDALDRLDNLRAGQLALQQKEEAEEQALAAFETAYASALMGGGEPDLSTVLEVLTVASPFAPVSAPVQPIKTEVSVDPTTVIAVGGIALALALL